MKRLIAAGGNKWALAVLAVSLAGCAHLSPPDRDASQDYVQPKETASNSGLPAAPEQGGGLVKGFLNIFGHEP